MTLTQFDNGYWYATDLKRFAVALGIPSVAHLRKDELERVIKQFLRTGTLASLERKKRTESEVRRDVDLGLRLDRRVVRYTNDPRPKDFLEREAKKLDHSYRRRSGARYRLNRWREQQLDKGSRSRIEMSSKSTFDSVSQRNVSRAFQDVSRVGGEPHFIGRPSTRSLT